MLAAAAMGPKEALSLSQPIMSSMFLIAASILDIKRATQKLRVGATGMGNDLGFFDRRVVEETSLWLICARD